MSVTVEELPLEEVYPLLEPGPVVLLTTCRDGRANVMTLSWHMMVDFVPPYIACIVSSNDFSFSAMRSTRDCVIAIPSVDLAEKVVAVGNCSGRETDKFKEIGLTPLPASKVTAPLIGECFANIECKVTDTRLVSQYNLFILEAVKAWHDPAQGAPKTIHHRGHGTFIVDGRTIHLDSAMP